MKNISTAFRRKLYNDERNYLAYADITLANNQGVLHLTNSEIWSGGFSFEQAVSEDESFTALGSVIIGSATLIINNIYETYSQYDFNNATVLMKIGLMIGTTPEIINVGKYRVDDATYNGATIKLSLLDYMEQFDRPYKTSLIYPATLLAVLQECCTNCGVTLNSQTFPHYNFKVFAPDIKDGVTYREVVSWVATIAGCYVKVNTNATMESTLGELELKWFDTSAFDTVGGLNGGIFDLGEEDEPYESGDTADGGTFNPWNTGYVADGGSFTESYGYHYLYSLASQNIAIDDTVITGVSIVVENKVKPETLGVSTDIINGNSVIIDVGENDTTYTIGTDGYIIQITDNGFITHDNVKGDVKNINPNIANNIIVWLADLLIGLRFRKMSVSRLDDPTVEAGDVAKVVDRKGNEYNILVTRATFSIGAYQQIVCGSETPLRNSATRYSEATKNYVKSKKLLRAEQTAREQAEEELALALASKTGLFTSEVEQLDHSKIFYLHDKPDLEDSTIVWKMTAEAWAVTTAYNSAHPEQTVWNAGVTFNGTVLAQQLSAIGIDADWITSGTISSRDGSNVWYLDTGVFTSQTTYQNEDSSESDYDEDVNWERMEIKSHTITGSIKLWGESAVRTGILNTASFFASDNYSFYQTILWGKDGLLLASYNNYNNLLSSDTYIFINSKNDNSLWGRGKAITVVGNTYFYNDVRGLGQNGAKALRASYGIDASVPDGTVPGNHVQSTIDMLQVDYMMWIGDSTDGTLQVKDIKGPHGVSGAYPDFPNGLSIKANKFFSDGASETTVYLPTSPPSTNYVTLSLVNGILK